MADEIVAPPSDTGQDEERRLATRVLRGQVYQSDDALELARLVTERLDRDDRKRQAAARAVRPDELVAHFRAKIYPGKVAPLHVPSADLAAAERLLALHPWDRLAALIGFLASAAAERYWRKRVSSVASLFRFFFELEAEAFAVPDEPLTPEAAVVHREFDTRLQKRDPGLALEPPGPADRATLNALVAKYGRDRVRFILRTAMESDHFSKRVYDVDTLARHAQTLVAESAELWASAKDELHDYLDPIPQEATA